MAPRPAASTPKVGNAHHRQNLQEVWSKNDFAEATTEADLTSTGPEEIVARGNGKISATEDARHQAAAIASMMREIRNSGDQRSNSIVKT